MALRSPIVCVLGHVDHGKTFVLDRIRGTTVASGEPGLITQHVGASFVPTKVVEKRCGPLLKKYKFKLTIPGLLFIDTPGHEAFTNLRKRGGSIADLAVLVIDIMQGIQPQTVEAIEILKNYKTPFIIAANKIDLIDGWIPNENIGFSETFSKQRDFVQEMLERKVYELMGKMAEQGFDSERFDRVKDFTKQILIIPISAKTGEGFSELLMFLAGLSQKFMEKKLVIETEKPAVGNVLEVKEVAGLGMTIDAIIYEGCIKIGDLIALATVEGPIITKVKALLQPAPLEEIRDSRKKFKNVKKIYAAAGLKISAPELEKAIAGSPLIVVKDEEKARKEVEEEVESVKIEKKTVGVIIKTDALGSLEAVVNLLQKSGITVRKADVGFVTKKDLLEAEAVKKQDRYSGVVFAFNIKIPGEIRKEAEDKNIKIFESNIIYRLDEDYKKWKEAEKIKEKEERLEKYIYPAKIRILPGYVFRVSKPAVVGIEVLGGIIKPKYPLMNEKGEKIGQIESLQSENQSIDKAEEGMRVAIAVQGVTVGRQINEGEILYTSIPLEQIYELCGKIKEKQLLEEIKKIKEREEK